MKTIKEFRLEYPMYDTVDDERLTATLHNKFYSSIPYDEFKSRFNPNAKSPYPPELVALEAEKKAKRDNSTSGHIENFMASKNIKPGFGLGGIIPEDANIPIADFPIGKAVRGKVDFSLRRKGADELEPGTEQNFALLPAKGEILPEVLKGVEKGFIPLTAAYNTALNLILAAVKRDPSRLDSIHNILTFQPQRGDQPFAADALKEVGVTDQNLGLPDGTIDNVGLVADVIGMGKLDKILRGAISTSPAKKAAKFEEDILKHTKDLEKSGKLRPKDPLTASMDDLVAEAKVVASKTKAKAKVSPERVAAQKKQKAIKQSIKENNEALNNKVKKPDIKPTKTVPKETIDSALKGSGKVVYEKDIHSYPHHHTVFPELKGMRNTTVRGEVIRGPEEFQGYIRNLQNDIANIDTINKKFLTADNVSQRANMVKELKVAKRKFMQWAAKNKKDFKGYLESQAVVKKLKTGDKVLYGEHVVEIGKMKDDLVEILKPGTKKLFDQGLVPRSMLRDVNKGPHVPELGLEASLRSGSLSRAPGTESFVDKAKEVLQREEGFARIAGVPRGKTVPIRGKVAKNIMNRKIVPQKFMQTTAKGENVLRFSDDQMDNMNAFVEGFGLKKRMVYTLKEIEDVAWETGFSVEELLNSTAKGIINKHQVVQLRSLQSFLGERIFNLTKEKSLPANLWKEREFDGEIAKLTNQLERAITNFIVGNNEIGRAAVANRILASKTLNPGFWLTKAHKLVEGKVNSKQLQDINNTIIDLVKKKDLNGLSEFVAGLKRADAVDVLLTIWKAGLLSSPRTQAANALGNSFISLMETTKDLVSVPLDVLVSMGTGKRTTAMSFGSVSAKIRSIPEAAKKGYSYLRTGTYADDIRLKWDLPSEIKFKNIVLNTYVNGIFRLLGSVDIFFREVAISESFVKQAKTIALNELKSGKLLKSQFKNKVRELLMTPTIDMTHRAIEVAEHVTFQNENMIYKMVRNAKRGAREMVAEGKPIRGKFGVVASEITIPFARTPTNIAARIADYSPVGFMKAFGQAITNIYKPTTNAQLKFVESIGRATTGTALMGLGYYMAEKGLLIGNTPEGKAEAEDFYAEKQPNSMLVGNRWQQLTRISPLGNLLLLGAEFYRLYNEEQLRYTDLTASTGFSFMKTLTEQTFLKGVSGTLKAINDPDRSGPKYVAQVVGSIVPSIIGNASRITDPVAHNPQNVYEHMKTRMFLGKNVAERVDVLGNKVLVAGERFAMVDPFASKEAVNNPVLQEVHRVGETIGLPSQTISGIKLTNKEYSAYQARQGKMLELALGEVFGSRAYQRANPDEKAAKIDKTKRLIRSHMNNTDFVGIMINRYGLSPDTNPEQLRQTLKLWSGNKWFQNASTQKQGEAIREYMKTKTSRRRSRVF